LSDHFHPGSNVYRPIVAPPIFTTSTCPWSNVLVSSGLSIPLFVTPISSSSSCRRATLSQIHPPDRGQGYRARLSSAPGRRQLSSRRISSEPGDGESS